MAFINRLYENYDMNSTGSSIGSKLKNNWKTLAGGAALGGIGTMLGDHFSDTANDWNNEMHGNADAGNYVNSWRDQIGNAVHSGESNPTAGGVSNGPLQSSSTNSTDFRDSTSSSGSNSASSGNSGNSSSGSNSAGTHNTITDSPATNDNTSEIDKLKNTITGMQNNASFNNQYNTLEDKPEGNAPWINTSKSHWFGDDTVTDKVQKVMPKDFSTAQKQEGLGQNINKIYDEWTNRNTSQGAAQANTMEELKAAMANANADNNVTPDEKANINKILMKAAGQQPEQNFGFENVKQSLIDQGHNQGDSVKSMDNILNSYGGVMSKEANAGLEGALKYAKDNGMQGLLDGNPANDLAYFNKQEAAGTLPPELQPLKDRLMTYMGQK